MIDEGKSHDIDWSKVKFSRVDKNTEKKDGLEGGDLFIVFLHNDEEFTIRLDECMSLASNGWFITRGPRWEWESSGEHANNGHGTGEGDIRVNVDRPRPGGGGMAGGPPGRPGGGGFPGQPGGGRPGGRPDGPGGGFPERPGGRPGGQGGGQGSFNLMVFDRNRDGKVAKSEVPPQMGRMFDQVDSNKDGFISQAEINAMRQNFPQGGGRPGGIGGRPGGQGGGGRPIPQPR